jgi:hypothetical protein
MLAQFRPSQQRVDPPLCRGHFAAVDRLSNFFPLSPERAVILIQKDRGGSLSAGIGQGREGGS